MPIDDIMRKTGARPAGTRKQMSPRQRRRSGSQPFTIDYQALKSRIKLDEETASLLADVVSILVNVFRLIP